MSAGCKIQTPNILILMHFDFHQLRQNPNQKHSCHFLALHHVQKDFGAQPFETFGLNFTFFPGRICHQRWFASGGVMGLARWPLYTRQWKVIRRYIFNWLLFHCHVNFWGCMYTQINLKEWYNNGLKLDSEIVDPPVPPRRQYISGI